MVSALLPQLPFPVSWIFHNRWEPSLYRQSQ